jgi:hypothetical protein
MPRPGRRTRHLRHPLAPWKVYDSCVAVLSSLASLLLESVASDDSMMTDGFDGCAGCASELQTCNRCKTAENKVGEIRPVQ